MSFDEKKIETVAPREAFKAKLKSERSKHERNVDLVLNASCLVAHRGFKQQNPAKNYIVRKFVKLTGHTYACHNLANWKLCKSAEIELGKNRGITSGETYF
jgi:hypothetical protein